MFYSNARAEAPAKRSPSAWLPSACAGIAVHLPFPLEETHRVNQAFLSWHEQGCPEARRIVELWTYCYLRRYFYAKLNGQPNRTGADVDALIDCASRKVEDGQDRLRDGSRYASWVSVICRHTFIDYLRRRRWHVSLDDTAVIGLRAGPPRWDEAAAMRAVDRAVRRLPPMLQEVARLYFVAGYSYEEVVRLTQRPIATVRTYVSRTRRLFRKDAELTALLCRRQGAL